jgi:hypothetical protein
LPGTPPFIQVAGGCPAAAALVAITIGDSLSTTTSGQIDPSSPIAAIFAATTWFNNLRTSLNNMGTGTVPLTISYTVQNGIMMVNGISCPIVPRSLFVIEQNVTALVGSSVEISQRLEKDLSGSVLNELRALNHHVGEALDILRAQMGVPRAPRAPQSGFAPPPPAGEDGGDWRRSGNGSDPELESDEERQAM